MGTAQYAEYGNPAPEYIAQPAPQTVYAHKAEEGYGYYQPQPEERPKRKICGLAPWVVITVVVAAIIIIVAVVVGVVVGTKQNKSEPVTTVVPTSTAVAPSQTASSASSTSSSATPTPTALEIIQAIYGSADITELAKKNIQQGPKLHIDMTNPDPWGTNPDPWFGIRKCLSILHSFGPSIRTFVGCERDGNYDILPGPARAQDHTREISRKSALSSTFSIVSVVWGAEEITSDTVYQTLLNFKNNGSQVPFTNELFLKDTMFGEAKSGVVWYTEDKYQTFKALYAKENDKVAF